MSCLVIAGLGNPGATYQNTRHNIGFMVLDVLSESLQFRFLFEKRFNAQVGEAMVGKQKVFFVKPQTYMNASGESLAPFMHYFDTQALMVIHDELDIPFGDIRFKYAGSNGGHNGLKSIDKHYGNHYTRIRFGIGRPLDSQMSIVDFVLSDFNKKESPQLPLLLGHCKEATLSFCLCQDIVSLQNQFTLKSKKHAHLKELNAF